jgi:multidrug efflux pump
MFFAAGLVMIFLILAAQYEKLSLPFGVMLAVPFGLFGAYLAIALRGISSDVYFQIGLDPDRAVGEKRHSHRRFAVLERAQDRPLLAPRSAARLRPADPDDLLRLHARVVPLVFASGAGAGSRHSIGTGVLGGMLVATVLAVFFVPLFYEMIESFSARLRRGKPVPTAASAVSERGGR